MTRKVELTPHNPHWAGEYENEAERLTAVFRPHLQAIHHIGSTAVPGIQAKPIIDILIEVDDIERVDGYNVAMNDLGYIAKGENGIDGRRYFRRGSDAHHTHHIHVFQTGHPDVERHLDFRDYLIAYPDVAQAYGRLKEELARKYDADPPSYTTNKSNFIEAAIAKAAVWRTNQSAALETKRLCLLPLSMSQLRDCLENRERLAQELSVIIPAAIFDDPVPRAIGMKLAKMANAATATHVWYTYWLVIVRNDAVGAGLIGFKGAPDAQGEVEIGYGIDAEFRNQGYATEAAAALLDWALAQPKCMAVISWTDTTNQPSIRVLEKAGMTRTGERDGRYHWRMTKGIV